MDRGENAWVTETRGLPPAAQERKVLDTYAALLERQTVTWHGVQVPVSGLRRFYRSPDRRERERAWRAEMERRAEDVSTTENLWEALVSMRRAMAAEAGAESFAELRRREMRAAGLTAREAGELRGAIEEFVTPVLVRLHERWRRRLKVRAVRPWDLPAERGTPDGEDPGVVQPGEGEIFDWEPARQRLSELEGTLLSWTHAAMIDSLESRVYAGGTAGATASSARWASLWLLYLPGVDWSGLEVLLPAERQRHFALVLHPCEALPLVAREISAWAAWAKGDGEPPLRVTAPDPAAVHDAARWIEDEMEAQERGVG